MYHAINVINYEYYFLQTNRKKKLKQRKRVRQIESQNVSKISGGII